MGIVAIAGLVLVARRQTMSVETLRGSLSSLLVAFFIDGLTILMGYLAVYRTRQGRGFRLGYFSLLVFAYHITVFQVAVAFLTTRMIEPASGGGPFVFLIAFSACLSILTLGLQFSASRLATALQTTVGSGESFITTATIPHS
jgi:hypothetical protein